MNIALGSIEQGIASPIESRHLTYDKIREAYIIEKPSRAEYFGLKHLDDFFGGLPVKRIDGDRVASFVAHRRRANCSDPTIRRN